MSEWIALAEREWTHVSPAYSFRQAPPPRDALVSADRQTRPDVCTATGGGCIPSSSGYLGSRSIEPRQSAWGLMGSARDPGGPRGSARTAIELFPFDVASRDRQIMAGAAGPHIILSHGALALNASLSATSPATSPLDCERYKV